MKGGWRKVKYNEEIQEEERRKNACGKRHIQEMKERSREVKKGKYYSDEEFDTLEGTENGEKAVMEGRRLTIEENNYTIFCIQNKIREETKIQGKHN